MTSQSDPSAASAAPHGSYVRRRIRSWWHGLDLVAQFAIMGSVVILLGMAALGLWIADRLERGILRSTADASAFQMDHFVDPLVLELAHRSDLSPEAHVKLDAFVREVIGKRIITLKIWRPDGTVVYSNQKDLIGQKFPMTARFEQALNGEIAAELDADPHEANDRMHEGNTPILEIYAPVVDPSDNRIVAISEYYSIERGLAPAIAQAVIGSWTLIASIGAAIMAGLLHIVSRGSRTIESQRLQLHEQIDSLKTLLDQNTRLRERIQSAHRRTTSVHEQVLRRVGADLHDGPAQMMSLALLLSNSLSPDSTDERRARQAAKLKSAIRDALREVRSISAGLTMPEILTASLAQVVQMAATMHASRTGTSVECNVTLPYAVDQSPDALKTCAYRFVQEALNNAFKHAKGKDQRVDAVGDRSSIVLTVNDGGPGLQAGVFQEEDEGLGIRGLRERVEALGGSFAVRSSPTGVTVVAKFDLMTVDRMVFGRDIGQSAG